VICKGGRWRGPSLAKIMSMSVEEYDGPPYRGV
jgi:hypothetical protein